MQETLIIGIAKPGVGVSKPVILTVSSLTGVGIAKHVIQTVFRYIWGRGGETCPTDHFPLDWGSGGEACDTDHFPLDWGRGGETCHTDRFPLDWRRGGETCHTDRFQLDWKTSSFATWFWLQLKKFKKKLCNRFVVYKQEDISLLAQAQYAFALNGGKHNVSDRFAFSTPGHCTDCNLCLL